MKRVNLNFIVDVVAFAGFVLLTTTGVLMRYILPPGSGHYSTIWGMDAMNGAASISGRRCCFFDTGVPSDTSLALDREC
jgi:hypothetical protein